MDYFVVILLILKKSDKLLGLVERKLVNDKFYVLRIDEQY